MTGDGGGVRKGLKCTLLADTLTPPSLNVAGGNQLMSRVVNRGTNSSLRRPALLPTGTTNVNSEKLLELIQKSVPSFVISLLYGIVQHIGGHPRIDKYTCSCGSSQ